MRRVLERASPEFLSGFAIEAYRASYFDLGRVGEPVFGDWADVLVSMLKFMLRGIGEVWVWLCRFTGSVWKSANGGLDEFRVGDIVHGGVEMLRGDGFEGV